MTIRILIISTICYIIPILAAIVLVVLNTYGFYIGGELSGRSDEDSWKLFGLYIASIAFCVSLIASIWHIHSRIPRGHRIRSPSPASFASDERSFILAKDTSVDFGRLSLTTISLIVCVSGLLLVNPTKVVIPDLRGWQAGGTNFWLNSTLEDMWPSRLEKEMESDRSCAAADKSLCFPSNIEPMGRLLSYWPHIDKPRKVMPEQVGILGRSAVRTLQVRYRGPFNYQPPLTSATIPSAQIADVLSELATYWSEANTRNCVKSKKNFCYYNDIEYAVAALQPVVYVKCNQNKVDDTFRFPRIDKDSAEFPLADFEVIFDKSTGKKSIPDVRWIDLPKDAFGTSSIGVAVSVPQNDENYGQLFGCTIDARWANSTAKILFSSGPMVVSGSPVDWSTSGRFETQRNGMQMWSPVKLSPTWAQDASYFSQLNTSSFIPLYDSLIDNNFSKILEPQNAMEAILAIMVAEGMSRTTSTAILQGTLKGSDRGDWMRELMPQDGAFKKLGDAFDTSNEGDDIKTQLAMHTTVNGYGYGRTVTRKPAIVFLCLYLVIVFFHLMFWSWQLWYCSRKGAPLSVYQKK